MDRHLREKIDEILGSNLGLLDQWSQIEKLLLEHGLACKQELPPLFFAVHPWWLWNQCIHMHSKGAMIASKGADLSQLSGSVAFALNPQKDDAQIGFTMHFAKASEGLLPVPTGCEGHTTQFWSAKHHRHLWPVQMDAWVPIFLPKTFPCPRWLKVGGSGPSFKLRWKMPTQAF